MKKFFIFIIFITFTIFTISTSVAEVFVGEKTNLTLARYAPGQILEGFLNISLKEEPAENLFRAFHNNIILLDFLLASLANFSCFPSDCYEYYVAKTGEKSKIVREVREAILAFSAEGNDVSASSLSFEISNASAAMLKCGETVSINFFDGISWFYVAPSDKFCEVVKSECLQEEQAEYKYIIDEKCQNLALPISGAFRLGADVKRISSGGDLKMKIEGNEGEAECELNEIIEEGKEARLSCIVNFTAFGGNYTVCIQDTKLNDAFQIKSESREPRCQEEEDYTIFAEPAEIPQAEKVIFNESFLYYEDILIGIDNYIKRFERNCSKGCAIPIAISSPYDLKINNIKFTYEERLGKKSSDKIYNAERLPAKINMNFSLLPISSLNFTAPYEYGNYTLYFHLGEKLLFSQKLAVEKVPIITKIFPQTTFAGIETKFFVSAYSPKKNKIVKYEWDFGDGTKETTTENFTKHVYTEKNIYKLKIKAIDNETLSYEKTFDVVVGVPKEVAFQMLKLKKESLDNFTKKLAEFPTLQKSYLFEVLEIEKIEEELKDIEELLENATEEVYIKEVMRLSEISLPDIYESVMLKEFVYVPEKIVPKYASALGAGEYDETREKELADSIFAWMSEYVEIKMDSKKYSADGKEIMNTFDIKISPKKTYEKNVYLIIAVDFESTKFASDYGQKKIDNIVGIITKLEENKENKFSFAAKEEMPLIFVSPSFSEFPQIVCNANKICEPELGETWENCGDCKKPKGKIVLFVVLAIIFVTGIFFFLKWWYTTKYESYLFKKREDLYNIITFINLARTKGMGEEEIKKKLRETGWKNEQIDYAMKKTKGKKVLGIFEKREKKK